MTVLKPAKRSLDWRECVTWANDRDAALKVFVLNWELRETTRAAATLLEMATGATGATVPFEPAPTSHNVVTVEETAE